MTYEVILQYQDEVGNVANTTRAVDADGIWYGEGIVALYAWDRDRPSGKRSVALYQSRNVVGVTPIGVDNKKIMREMM